MATHQISRFIELLRLQATGDSNAVDAIRALGLSVRDGYCLYNLYEQWSAAFSYVGGRQDALTPILSAAEKIRSFQNDDTLLLYNLPEWESLVALRGPAECVMRKRCADCACEYAAVGTSGFYDANALVCRTCGNVHFKSYYDEANAPTCSCGTVYSNSAEFGCPQCGSAKASTIAECSPYEYFATHSFTRGPGA